MWIHSRVVGKHQPNQTSDIGPVRDHNYYFIRKIPKWLIAFCTFKNVHTTYAVELELILVGTARVLCDENKISIKTHTGSVLNHFRDEFFFLSFFSYVRLRARVSRREKRENIFMTFLFCYTHTTMKHVYNISVNWLASKRCYTKIYISCINWNFASFFHVYFIISIIMLLDSRCKTKCYQYNMILRSQ